jgi:Mn2+/Fe2+ NRAMP family transporter
MSASPNDFFTPAGIASVAVATAAVNAAAIALYSIAKIPRKRTAFISALVIAFVVTGVKTAPQWYDWLLAFFNACLLYCSALGLNETAARAGTPRQGVAAGSGPFRSWFS